MRKTFAVVVTILMFVAFIGQVAANPSYKPGQTAEAYSYIHGGYVGKAVVKVMANGSLDVTIDEAFLPHVLAEVEVGSDGWTDTNTVSYVSHGRAVPVAKYIEYAGKVYVGTTVGTSVTYVEAGKSGEPAGALDLELIIVRNQDSMATYFNTIQSGGFKILTGFGGRATVVTTTTYGGLTKKNSEYWNSGQTWKGNMAAIETFIEQKGAAYSRSEMVRATQADAKGLKFWSVADAVTGATNSDFRDYFALAQAAIAQLKTN